MTDDALRAALERYGKHESSCERGLPITRCLTCDELLDVPKCPQYLNAEQWGSVKAGDYYCATCPGDRGESGRRYYWERELPTRSCSCGLDTALAAEPTPSDGQAAVWREAIALYAAHPDTCVDPGCFQCVSFVHEMEAFAALPATAASPPEGASYERRAVQPVAVGPGSTSTPSGPNEWPTRENKQPSSEDIACVLGLANCKRCLLGWAEDENGDHIIPGLATAQIPCTYAVTQRERDQADAILALFTPALTAAQASAWEEAAKIADKACQSPTGCNGECRLAAALRARRDEVK